MATLQHCYKGCDDRQADQAVHSRAGVEARRRVVMEWMRTVRSVAAHAVSTTPSRIAKAAVETA